jgi:toxin FitB
MIILDTNVLSELISKSPDERVLKWVDGLPRITVWTSSVSVFELQYGISILPEGKRRDSLGKAVDDLFNVLLENRIMPFDTSAAGRSVAAAATHRAQGRPVEVRDLLIAGIALSSGASLATRNLKDFEGIGLDLINPWAF